MSENSERIEILGDLLEEIPLPGQENALSVVRSMDNDGKAIARIEVTRKIVSPERMESPPRSHVFHDAKGFKDYLDKYGTEDTVVFAEVENKTIWAVRNEKADKGFEVFSLVPTLHPLFAPWDRILGNSMPLEKYVEFLLANRKAVESPDGRELLLMISQIRASNNTTLTRGQGTNSTKNGIMCEVKIQAETKNELVDLPEAISILCPIYYKTKPRKLEIDTIMSMQRGEISVLVTSADVDVAKLEAFDEMIEALRTDARIVTTGKPVTSNWSYIN